MDSNNDKLLADQPQTLFPKYTLLIPLQMEWKPKEDITTYELALCLPYLMHRSTMPYEIDQSEPHFRHFKITDHNGKTS